MISSFQNAQIKRKNLWNNNSKIIQKEKRKEQAEAELSQAQPKLGLWILLR